MIEFTHVISSFMGLHARPVALIARCALDHASSITLFCRGQMVQATDLIGLMGLDARRDDTLTVEVDGPDEEETTRELKAIFQEML